VSYVLSLSQLQRKLGRSKHNNKNITIKRKGVIFAYDDDGDDDVSHIPSSRSSATEINAPHSPKKQEKQKQKQNSNSHVVS